MSNIPTGFTGFTIDSFGGSTSDSEGNVSKVLFIIYFQPRINDVEFTITNGADHWSALTPTGENIKLLNPVVVEHNRDSAIVQFDMQESYPSNSMLILNSSSSNAKYKVIELDTIKPFKVNTITGNLGFTTSEYGGSVDDDGQVMRIIFNIPYQYRLNDCKFTISNRNDEWAVLMGDGSYINLINPIVINVGREGTTVVFQMTQRYPSGSPGLLVRRKESATYSVAEISTELPFVPVQNITFPPFLTAGDRHNLSVSAVVYPMDCSLHNISWSIMDDGSTDAKLEVTKVSSFLTCKKPGRIKLRAKILNGLAIGVSYDKEINIEILKNDIIIEQQPHSITTVKNGNIDGYLSVVASTESGNLTYQWYQSHNSLDNTSGIAIAGEESNKIEIPKNLLPGDYFYFCEVRKVNFESVRTNVATVRVRDDLQSITIYPTTLNKVAGDINSNLTDFVVTLNPPTVDENLVVEWRSSKEEVAKVEQRNDNKCAARVLAYNNGSTTITAFVGNKSVSATLNVGYVPVSNIYWPMEGFDVEKDTERTIKTDNIYNLPTKVYPENCTYKDIKWSIRNDSDAIANTAGAIIRDNSQLICSREGSFVLTGRIYNGATPFKDFTQDFNINVVKNHSAVTDIVLNNDVSSLTTADSIKLNASCRPLTSTMSNIIWSIVSDGGTGCKLEYGSILSFTNSGTCTIRATVRDGVRVGRDFTKDFNIGVQKRFVPVENIVDFPAHVIRQDPKTHISMTRATEVNFDEGEGNGIKLVARAVPSNATNKLIQYRVLLDKSDQRLGPHIDEESDGFYLRFNGVNQEGWSMSHTDINSHIYVKMTIEDGLAPGRNFENEIDIYVIPPLKPVLHVPVSNITYHLLDGSNDSKIRVHRPIAVGKSQPNPYNCSFKNIEWNMRRETEETGALAILDYYITSRYTDDGGNIVEPTVDKFKLNYAMVDDAKFNGYWENKINYFYPLSKGNVLLTATIFDGNAYGTPFTESKLVKILDPYIPIKAIENLPTEICSNKKTYLSPELDTQGGMNYKGSFWDDRIPTYTNVEYSIVSGSDLITINDQGVITPKGGTGPVTIQLKVQSGTQEYNKFYYEYFRNTTGLSSLANYFTKKDFTMNYTTTVSGSSPLLANRILRITTTTNAVYDVNTKAEFDALRSIGGPDDYIQINNVNIKRNAIMEIEFSDKFTYTDLTNFGTNFTSLIRINKIPSTVTKLRNFLKGCISFNMPIIIPSGVTGDRCLEGFLRDCQLFDQPITIPSTVKGHRCLESFLRGCSSFNKPITIPATLTNYDYSLYCFLQDCIAFNSNITLPSTISGKRCMENFMRGCKSFNKPVMMPGRVSGQLCLAGFMFECDGMNSGIGITTKNCAESLSECDILSFSTMDQTSRFTNSGDARPIQFGGNNAAGGYVKNYLPNIGDHSKLPDIQSQLPIRRVDFNYWLNLTKPADQDIYCVSVLIEVSHPSGKDNFNVNNNVNYTITIMNMSNKTIHDIELLCTIPEEMTYVSMSSSISGYTNNTVLPQSGSYRELRNTVTNITSMNPNTSGTVLLNTKAYSTGSNIPISVSLSYREDEDDTAHIAHLSITTIDIV